MYKDFDFYVRDRAHEKRVSGKQPLRAKRKYGVRLH